MAGIHNTNNAMLSCEQPGDVGEGDWKTGQKGQRVNKKRGGMGIGDSDPGPGTNTTTARRLGFRRACDK